MPVSSLAESPLMTASSWRSSCLRVPKATNGNSPNSLCIGFCSRENTSVYRFTHRIFAEYLATEALLRREVTQPYIDCLAPRASGQASQVHATTSH